MSNSIIVVIDDHARWLKQITKSLIPATETQIIGVKKADDLITALEDNEDVRVVLFDQDLGVGLGSDLVKRVVEMWPQRGLILLGLTSSTRRQDIEMFRDAGADGMASKAALLHDLPRAIAKLNNGFALDPEDRETFEVPLGFVNDWLFG